MTSKLDQLKNMTTVVADTGDMESVARLKPVDCTTNPTIVLDALRRPAFQDVFAEAIHWGTRQGGERSAVVSAIADRLAVSVGIELSKLVPGLVSTEVDADLSFDTTASVAKARQIIAAYKERGVERDRVLIKLASTWEGIRAAEILQMEGINCNLTLLFNLTQAIACADAGVFLISPFVGRILDWYKKLDGKDYHGEADPGVRSVKEIYGYYKSRGVETIVMGASFRTTEQIELLAGCDRLTISPALLDQLSNDHGKLSRALSPSFGTIPVDVAIDEQRFRWNMNEDQMASEKLAEGIRGFARDLRSLRETVALALA